MIPDELDRETVVRILARRQERIERDEALIEAARERQDRCDPPAPHDPQTCESCALVLGPIR